MGLFRKTVIVTAITAIMASPAPVMAKDHKHHYDENDQGEGAISISISLTDHVIIQNYLDEEYHPKHCPPGLAKKHNGCLPPGIAKKYNVGRPLPEDVAYPPLPYEIAERLHPVAGYRYVQVDQDVLLISEASKKVIDAVTLLSAVK